MTVITLEKRNEFREKPLEEKMREMHLCQQIISCIDFVIEKTSQMEPDSPLIDDLQNILDVFDRKHEQVVTSIAVNKNRSGANS